MTDDMNDPQFQELKIRLVRLETRDEENSNIREKMSKQLDELTADLHERRGRDRIAARQHVEEREDDFQKSEWLRAFLPTGILTGLWLAALEVVKSIFHSGSAGQ